MRRRALLLGSCAWVLACTRAWAQAAGDAAASPAQDHLNPLADVAKLSSTLGFELGAGPGSKTVPSLNFQPVLPFGLNENWRAVSRSNVSVAHLPDPEKRTGLGDLSTSLFLTPAKTGAWVWGAGPAFQIPTATNSSLGSGKWSAGPTAALLYVEGPWVNGILVGHLWSFAGNSHRPPVSLTQIELQVSYTFQNDWYVQTNPTLSYDWKQSGQGWTVPVGIDVGKAWSAGARGWSLQAGAYYNVKKPDGAGDWVLRTQLTWIF